jgi:hypothetical protein
MGVGIDEAGDDQAAAGVDALGVLGVRVGGSERRPAASRGPCAGW